MADSDDRITSCRKCGAPRLIGVRCSPCGIARCKSWRSKNAAYVRKKNASYKASHREEISVSMEIYRVKNRSRLAVSQELYRRANLPGFAARARKHRERHPARTAARLDAYNAILRGDLVVSPCEVCGLKPRKINGRQRIEAHHDDYSKPLEVRWLCVPDHREADRILREDQQ